MQPRIFDFVSELRRKIIEGLWKHRAEPKFWVTKITFHTKYRNFVFRKGQRCKINRLEPDLSKNVHWITSNSDKKPLKRCCQTFGYPTLNRLSALGKNSKGSISLYRVCLVSTKVFAMADVTAVFIYLKADTRNARNVTQVCSLASLFLNSFWFLVSLCNSFYLTSFL